MLRIRLQRIGRKKRPSYRIVVAEHSVAATKNNYVESLGFYNSIASEKVFEVDKDKILEWIKKGAKPSNTLARLLKGDGMKGMEPYIVKMADRKKKNEKEEKPAPVVEAPKEEVKKEEEKPAPVVETPKEEVKEEVKEEEKPTEEESSKEEAKEEDGADKEEKSE